MNESEVGVKNDTSSSFGEELIDKHEESSSMFGEIRPSSMGLGNDFPEPAKKFFSKFKLEEVENNKNK